MYSNRFIRTTMLVAALSAFAMFCFGAAAHAQTAVVTTGGAYPGGAAFDRTHRADLGINISGALGDNQIDDGYFIGGNFSYGFNPWFAMGLEVGWQDASTANNDLSAIPIFVDGIVRFQNLNWSAPVVPYGIVGVGAIIWDYDRDDLSLNNLDDDVDSSFAVKTGVGVDWFLNDHWALNGEISYVFTDQDIEITNGSHSDLDYWAIGGGVKYVF